MTDTSGFLIKITVMSKIFDFSEAGEQDIITFSKVAYSYRSLNDKKVLHVGSVISKICAQVSPGLFGPLNFVSKSVNSLDLNFSNRTVSLRSKKYS